MAELKRPALPRSLGWKLVYVVALGLLLGAGLNLLVTLSGNALVDKVYMSPENQAARRAEIYKSLSSYAQDYAVSGTDTQALERWSAENEYVALIVYGTGSKLWSFAGGKGITGDREDLAYMDGELRLYPIRFQDDTYLVSVVDGSAAQQYLLVDLAAVLSSALAFMLCLLWYMRRMARRIRDLARAAQELGSGRLDVGISSPGEDEIGLLAQAMDEMRLSLLDRMQSEREAWQANSQLLTAISHDIRTPMTSVIGYLGLLNDSGLEDKERCAQFVRRAYEKAMDLKYLTDELFKYFLAFGSKLELETEWLDGGLLCQQLLGEAEFSLQEAGYLVQRQDTQAQCQVLADPPYLKRVIDNLVSNIRKYADPQGQVLMLSRLEGEVLSICISNVPAPGAGLQEGSRIGLRTCGRIMDQMGGTFSAGTENGRFTARLSLPAKIKQDS